MSQFGWTDYFDSLACVTYNSGSCDVGFGERDGPAGIVWARESYRWQ